jgi:hypothetical protein
MLALDANAFTYWIDAMNGAPDEPSGRLAEEKIALVRIFFWMPSDASFKLVPTVRAEHETIRDQQKLNNHVDWAMTHVSQVRPLPDEARVAGRANALSGLHAGENDRKILAECELTGINAFLTCDTKFIDRLRMETRVWLTRPSEFWDRMRVPKGRPPNKSPAAANPLLQCSWFRW